MNPSRSFSRTKSSLAVATSAPAHRHSAFQPSGVVVPPDVILEICSFLSTDDLASFRLTCRALEQTVGMILFRSVRYTTPKDPEILMFPKGHFVWRAARRLRIEHARSHDDPDSFDKLDIWTLFRWLKILLQQHPYLATLDISDLEPLELAQDLVKALHEHPRLVSIVGRRSAYDLKRVISSSNDNGPPRKSLNLDIVRMDIAATWTIINDFTTLSSPFFTEPCFTVTRLEIYDGLDNVAFLSLASMIIPGLREVCIWLSDRHETNALVSDGPWLELFLKNNPLVTMIRFDPIKPRRFGSYAYDVPLRSLAFVNGLEAFLSPAAHRVFGPPEIAIYSFAVGWINPPPDTDPTGPKELNSISICYSEEMGETPGPTAVPAMIPLGTSAEFAATFPSLKELELNGQRHGISPKALFETDPSVQSPIETLRVNFAYHHLRHYLPDFTVPTCYLLDEWHDTRMRSAHILIQAFTNATSWEEAMAELYPNHGPGPADFAQVKMDGPADFEQVKTDVLTNLEPMLEAYRDSQDPYALKVGDIVDALLPDIQAAVEMSFPRLRVLDIIDGDHHIFFDISPVDPGPLAYASNERKVICRASQDELDQPFFPRCGRGWFEPEVGYYAGCCDSRLGPDVDEEWIENMECLRMIGVWDWDEGVKHWALLFEGDDLPFEPAFTLDKFFIPKGSSRRRRKLGGPKGQGEPSDVGEDHV